MLVSFIAVPMVQSSGALASKAVLNVQRQGSD